MPVKPISKDVIDIIKTIEQREYIDRLTSTINKCIKNDIFVISYNEYIDEGMSMESFKYVLQSFIDVGWKINIKEFDIELS